jgi:AraC-like DNA-binding protein
LCNNLEKDSQLIEAVVALSLITMPITLSCQTYWDLFEEAIQVKPLIHSDLFDVTWQYPSQLGQGFVRQIKLREGIDLEISQYQPRDTVILKLPEREHPIEYTFLLLDEAGADRPALGGQYSLWGSGTAPAEVAEHHPAKSTQIEVNVHIEPEQFLAQWQGISDQPPTLQHLIKPNSELYHTRTGTMTTAMQTAVQQVLHCPFQGITKRMYLESKVWELMALLIEHESGHPADPSTSQQPANQQRTDWLKPDDVDRIHCAREILVQRIDNPPSLIELARQVGLNDCTLKRGFRQVFGTTAFGFLHDYRLEQARRLLEERCMNVSEVARAIGFVNRSYFAAAFRKKFGVTPREYLSRSRNSA